MVGAQEDRGLLPTTAPGGPQGLLQGPRVAVPRAGTPARVTTGIEWTLSAEDREQEGRGVRVLDHPQPITHLACRHFLQREQDLLQMLTDHACFYSCNACPCPSVGTPWPRGTAPSVQSPGADTGTEFRRGEQGPCVSGTDGL